MKTLIAIYMVLALAGCSRQVQTESGASVPVTTDNPKLDAAYMGTVDGCRVFRFTDYGNEHYFVNCPSGPDTVSESQTHQCGKTRCTHYEDVPTGYGE